MNKAIVPLLLLLLGTGPALGDAQKPLLVQKPTLSRTAIACSATSTSRINK